MPYYYDFETIEWPEDTDDDYWPEPAAEEYQYLKPEDLGGGRDPVSIGIPESVIREGEKVSQTKGLVPATTFKNKIQMFFINLIFRMLLGKNFRKLQQGFASGQDEYLRHRNNTFYTMLPALQRIGAEQLICGYDGGNDEGFAWLRTVKTTDAKLSPKQAAEKMLATGVVQQMRDLGMVRDSPDYPQTDEQVIENSLEGLVEELAVMLLGEGFGTGNFQMYGAFTVDLQELTITDDPDATMPTDGNLQFPTSESANSEEE